MDTEAAVLFGTNDLRIEKLTLPDPGPGQVLVEVAYSGICHTQLSEVRGRRGVDRFLPHTLGHEGSGRVLATGPSVTKVKKGDSVVLTWIKGKGADVPSAIYNSGNTRINSGAISTFMKQTITCENRVVPIPESMPLREAALLGCMIPTGAGIIFNAAKVKPGMSVVVFGVGGIGLSAVMAARKARANPILAVDIFDSKLTLARSVGATHGINAAQTKNVLQAIGEILGKAGADVAVEAAGRPETMETAFNCVRPGGGLCVLAGNLAHGGRITIDPFDLIRGKRIVGTWGGETDPDRDIPEYVRMYLKGELNFNPLITHEYSLKQLTQAFSDLENGRLGRSIVKF